MQKTANKNNIQPEDSTFLYKVIKLKTPQSKRVIPLNEKSIVLFNDIMQMQSQRKTQSEDHLLFANYDGNPFFSSSYSDFWSRIKRGYKNKTGKI